MHKKVILFAAIGVLAFLSFLYIIEIDVETGKYGFAAATIILVIACALLSHFHGQQTKMRAAKEKAEQISLVKSQFLATVSHEIRTPINAILGIMSVLQETSLSDEQKAYLETARTSGKTLLTIINDILDFSKMEAGKLRFEQAAFDTVNFFSSTVELMAPRAMQKGIELSSVIDPRCDDYLIGDSSRLRQVLFNLIGNAIKFTEEGGVIVKLLVEAKNSQTITIQIIVQDTGIGIDPSMQEKIFQAFSQADNSFSRRYEGTGLGLAITQRLLKQMGGDIKVASELGTGSLFQCHLTLPRHQPANPIISAHSLAQLAQIPLEIIDGDSIQCQAIAEQCSLLGIKTLVSPSLPVIKPDKKAKQLSLLMINHEHIPNLESYLKDFQQSSRRKLVKTILLSNQSTTELTTFATSNLIDAWIKKPVRLASLVAWIAEVCSLSLQTSLHREQTADCERPLSTPAKQARVLLVEDSQANQLVVESILGRHGYHIDSVFNGIESLQALQTAHYDLVLMDVHMPEMDGYTATRNIRKLSSTTADIPIIAMTANTQAADQQKCQHAGMNDYLAKPFDKQDLLNKVAQWVA